MGKTLTEKLREGDKHGQSLVWDADNIFTEAADRIEELEAEVERLQQAYNNITLAIGSHACSGLDCVGIYTPPATPAEYRCHRCQMVNEQIAKIQERKRETDYQQD